MKKRSTAAVRTRPMPTRARPASASARASRARRGASPASRRGDDLLDGGDGVRHRFELYDGSFHGCAASSAPRAEKEPPRARGRRSAARRRAGRRRSPNGTLIAGWPVTLTIGVNGVNSPPRRNCSHGSSGSNTQPIGTGSIASVGVSTTSTSCQNETTRRASCWSAATARAKSTLDVARARSASERLSGISSSGSTGIERRAGRPQPRERSSSASSRHGGVASTTSWPSAASASAASRATAATRGSTVVRDRRLDRERDPQPAGVAPTSSRNGRSGGVAQCASPRLVAGEHVEERGRVAHGHRQARSARARASPTSTAPARRDRATASARRARSTRRGCGSSRRRPSRARAAARRPRPRRRRRPTSRRACASVSHGLRQAPFSSDSVTHVVPNSGVFDLPMTTKPASFMRRTTARVGGRARSRRTRATRTSCARRPSR